MTEAFTAATSAHPDMLTPGEAAVVADVPIRDVHRALDERILPEGFYSLGEGRRVHAAACPLISFYNGAARNLTAEERVRIVATVGRRIQAARTEAGTAAGPGILPSAERTVVDGFLTVDLSAFFAGAEARRERLEAARAAVVEDPAILGGTPVLLGTRVPVHDVAASIERRLPLERVLDAYPGLTSEAVELARLYAKAHPPRGRPRRLADRFPEATLVSERRLPRRRPA